MATNKSEPAYDNTQHAEHENDITGVTSHGAEIQATKDMLRLKEDATLATADEHSMTFREAVRRYPKAIAWSMLVTMCIVMDGYDTALIGGFFAFPAFQRHYGHELKTQPGKWTVEGKWQMALGMGSPVGNMVGIAANGFLTERFGHKKVLHGGLLLICALVFIQFFAPSIQVLFVGQLLLGIPWGIFATMAPGFASEVAPLALRSYLEVWVVTCWGIGQFFSYAVLFTLNTNLTHWAYRIPFAIQWVWPVIIIPFALFCPESPWWLVRKGRFEDAERSILRLSSGNNPELLREQAKKTVALMIETNKLERELNEGTTYAACFRGYDLRRTEIAAATWTSQVLTGFAIQAWATYFFQQAGLNSSDSFKMTLGTGGVHLLFNLLSGVATAHIGRRRLYLWGALGGGGIMFIIGILGFPKQSSAYGFATSALYLVWFAIYCLTLGPLPYIINGEVSSTRLRTKTIAIARGSYQTMGIISSCVTPYILNSEYADLRGKTGLLTGGLNVLCFVWAFFRLPETGGRTYEELDLLFAERDLPARQFRHAAIERDGEVVRVVRGGAKATGSSAGSRFGGLFKRSSS